MQTTFKIFLILCAFTTTDIFGARPASPVSADALLQAQFDAVDAMSGVEALSLVIPHPLQYAEQFLNQELQGLKKYADHQIFVKEALFKKAHFKYSLVAQEWESSDDQARKKKLHNQLVRLSQEYDKALGQVTECNRNLEKNNTVPIFLKEFHHRRCMAMSHKASLLLAQKEKLEQEKAQMLLNQARLQEANNQWQVNVRESQQREQALLAQIEQLKISARAPQSPPPPYQG